MSNKQDIAGTIRKLQHYEEILSEVEGTIATLRNSLFVLSEQLKEKTQLTCDTCKLPIDCTVGNVVGSTLNCNCIYKINPCEDEPL